MQRRDRLAHCRIEPGAAGVEMGDDGRAHTRVSKPVDMRGDASNGSSLAPRDEELANPIGHGDELIRLRHEGSTLPECAVEA